MGGASSEVSDGTTEVIVESAIFDPVFDPPDRPALRPALGGEPALREGPGVPARADRGRPRRRPDRDVGRRDVAPGRVDSAPAEPEPARLAFRPARINRLLGTSLGPAEQRAILGPGRDRDGRAPRPRSARSRSPASRSRSTVEAAPARDATRGDRSRPGGRTSRSRATWPRRSPGSVGYEDDPADPAGHRHARIPRRRHSAPAHSIRETLAGAGLTRGRHARPRRPAQGRDVHGPAERSTDGAARATIRPTGRPIRAVNAAVGRARRPAPGPARQPARGRGLNLAPGPRRHRGLRGRQGLRLRRSGRRRPRMVAAWLRPDRRSRPAAWNRAARGLARSMTRRASSSCWRARLGFDGCRAGQRCSDSAGLPSGSKRHRQLPPVRSRAASASSIRRSRPSSTCGPSG